MSRVPPSETQAVTHMKDINGGAMGTTTLVYRPLSAQSALSQSGAVRPGESASTAAYYNPRQHVDVPESLVGHVLPAFMEAKKHLLDGSDKGEGRLTERGTLELIDYLRFVLMRGAVELQGELPETWLFKKFPFNSREFLDWAPRARNEICHLQAADVKSRLHYQASPAIISELSRLHGKVSGNVVSAARLKSSFLAPGFSKSPDIDYLGGGEKPCLPAAAETSVAQ